MLTGYTGRPQIDSEHCRAICDEIGYRLRDALSMNACKPPAHLIRLLQRFEEQEIDSPPIAPSLEDMLEDTGPLNRADALEGAGSEPSVHVRAEWRADLRDRVRKGASKSPAENASGSYAGATTLRRSHVTSRKRSARSQRRRGSSDFGSEER